MENQNTSLTSAISCSELLTNYGELYEFWFDGANGGRGYYSTDSLHTRKITADYYPWESLTEMVYELQPNCVVHGGSAQKHPLGRQRGRVRFGRALEYSEKAGTL